MLSVTRIARENAMFNVGTKSISTLYDSTIWFKEMFLYFAAEFSLRVTAFKIVRKAIPKYRGNMRKTTFKNWSSTKIRLS